MADEATALTDENWRTGTRTQIIEWWRGQGYSGPVSYTKADMIPKVEEWLAAPPAAEGGEGNVTPIKPKRSRAKKATATEAEASGEAPAAQGE